MPSANIQKGGGGGRKRPLVPSKINPVLGVLYTKIIQQMSPSPYCMLLKQKHYLVEGGEGAGCGKIRMNAEECNKYKEGNTIKSCTYHLSLLHLLQLMQRLGWLLEFELLHHQLEYVWSATERERA